MPRMRFEEMDRTQALKNMARIPTTSMTLLRDVASDSQHARWSEFVERYRPMMEAYLHERFPHVDADDMVQETLVALIKSMPAYRYVPEETGHFRNYLTGILRHKALRSTERSNRQGKLKNDYAYAMARKVDGTIHLEDGGDDEWRRSLMEIALGQFLADESINARTREVFRRVAVNGEKPVSVAESFGISRNAVDQIKDRARRRLKDIIKALEEVGGE